MTNEFRRNMKTIHIINGPNLNLLGIREPEIYGRTSFEEYFEELKKHFQEVSLHSFQSNYEGAMIDKLHEIGFSSSGIVINPAAYSHYSYAIADAIRSISSPVIEVHISDLSGREEFRRKSVTGDACQKVISGMGLEGYKQAIEELLKG